MGYPGAIGSLIGIYDLTAQMAELRRQMKLCEDIAERCGVVEMVVNEIERGQFAEKKKPAEKKKCEKRDGHLIAFVLS